MRIIIGLGNPDKKYQGTRHNAGFMAVDQLAADQGLSWHQEKTFNALVARSPDFYLVKPLTYMNESGQAAQKIMAYYHLLPLDEKKQVKPNSDLSDALIVIHDDLDIAFGTYKYSTGGSAAGHKGVQSVIMALYTNKFTRLRLGLGTDELAKRRRSFWAGAVARFVLKKFPPAEKQVLTQTIAQALRAIA